MEIYEWALKILTSESLEDKLFQPLLLTDNAPHPPLIISEPARAPSIQFFKTKKKEKLPRVTDLKHPDKRAACLHRFAGHELLAVEIMAFTLLAFPEAPKSFRKGLAHTLAEEQGHVKLYCKRLKELDCTFGDIPLYRNFWSHTPGIKSPLHYVSIMSLTLEMANLDFAPTYGKAFSEADDFASSELMATILQDEIAHVKFGFSWLKKMKSHDLEDWEAWNQALQITRLTPKRAQGFIFYDEPRLKAGITEEWIQKLREAGEGPSQ